MLPIHNNPQITPNEMLSKLKEWFGFEETMSFNLTEEFTLEEKKNITQEILGKLDYQQELYQDLEIFFDQNHLKENSIYAKINQTQTIFGDHHLKWLLLNPLKESSQIKKKTRFF
jgi:hypothetical protein